MELGPVASAPVLLIPNLGRPARLSGMEQASADAAVQGVHLSAPSERSMDRGTGGKGRGHGKVGCGREEGALVPSLGRAIVVTRTLQF
ncbi:unnamed protein product [Urochloa humidicola]